MATAQPERPRSSLAASVAPYCWYDGAIVETDAVQIEPISHALHYGSGVFEGIRAYKTERGLAVFRLKDHMERFLRSAEVYRLDVPYGVDALCAAVVEMLRRNRMDDCYIRPLAWFGAGGMSLCGYTSCPTHTLLATWPQGGYFSNSAERPTVRVTVSPWQKNSSKALPSTVKCSGHYANSVLAMSDAVARGFNEALMLNDRGRVAEGSGENIFYVKGGELYTNDVGEDILPGITRASVLTIAQRLGIPTHVGTIALVDLLAADEVFMTGTAAEVTGIREIDGAQLPHGANAAVTARLQAAYEDAVRGKSPEAAEWLTPV